MIPLSAKALGKFSKIYCDTNILRRLHGYYQGTSTPFLENLNQWCEELLANDTDLCISVLCLSEFLHSFFVSRAKKFCEKKAVNFNDLKKFKTKHKRLYREFMRENLDIYKQLDEIIASYSFKLVYPTDCNRPVEEINTMIATGATDFHKKYPVLDAADSFHLSIAVYSGIRDFLTLDNDFEGVSDINIYTIS